jgi:hypothetical protein
MKHLILLAGVALLASCGSKTDEPAAGAATEEAMPADAAATPAMSATPGSYDVTQADGTVGVDTLMADGTYVSRDANDKVTEKGTWASKDGKTCFTPEGKSEMCYTEGARAADGSFDATGPDGKVTHVKPHAG